MRGEGLAHLVAVVREQLAVTRQHRPVHHPVAEVQEERLVFIVADELQRLFGQRVIGVRDALGKVVGDRRVFLLAKRIIRVVGGGEVFGAIAHTAMDPTGLINGFEAEGGGVQADVPLAVMARAIAVVFQRIGEGHMVQAEVSAQEGFDERLARPSTRKTRRGDVGVAELCGVLASDNPRTRGRAGRGRSVGLWEVHTQRGQLDEVRRLIRARIVYIVDLLDVLPAQIIDVEDDDVRLVHLGPGLLSSDNEHANEHIKKPSHGGWRINRQAVFHPRPISRRDTHRGSLFVFFRHAICFASSNFVDRLSQLAAAIGIYRIPPPKTVPIKPVLLVLASRRCVRSI